MAGKPSEKLFRRENYLNVQITYMKIVGMFPIDYAKFLPQRLEFLSSVLNRMYFAFWQLISMHIAIVQIASVYVYWGESLDELSPYLNNSVIYLFTYFIITYFQFKYNSHAKLIAYINENFEMRSAQGLTYVTIEPAYKAAKRFTNIWVISCIFGTLHWAFSPILTGVRALPLQSWYPFDALKSPQYEILYACQCLGQINVAIGFGIVGAMLMSKITLVNVQYDMLFCSIKNLLYTAMILKGNRMKELKKLQDAIDWSKSEVNEYYVSKDILENLSDIPETKCSQVPHSKRKPEDTYLMEYNDELMMALRDCIKHHQMINIFCNKLEDFYNAFNFGKFFQVTILICLLANLLLSAEYLSLASSELLIFCHYASMITYQSTRLNEAIIRSPWYMCGGPVRRDMLIMLTNTVKPFVLTGGKFFQVTIDNFRTTMTASFSYYTLLTKFRRVD
ncbi:odorant receptor 83a [Phlebotomus papatasi]|uniref:odorant receptor 83a n=1 Tax=Phlebotomus papatasi TaxID=29031 RepID=UPI0024833969|nr:odorant receptor 83a [Phlebotomus papatasi]